MTSGERGKTVTAVCAMNASGTYLPPNVNFSEKQTPIAGKYTSYWEGLRFILIL